MSNASRSNGPPGPTDWNAVDWRWANTLVRNLRRRIYRATAEGDLRKVRSLQKLMLRSHANHLVSVRRVSQQNAGAKTPGVDRVLVKTPAARGRLVDMLKATYKTRARPVRRIYIPKAIGKKRPLGIPVMFDRALQAMVKNALEPEWEARFEARSYGFRPGRSAQDAIQTIFHCSHSGCRKKWIVDADIKGCFDNIDHDYLLRVLGHFPATDKVAAWLKAGYMEEGVLHRINSGTPQGGVISPVLANVALHGLDQTLGIVYRKTSQGYQRTFGDRAWVRYADDFVVFCKTHEDAEKVVEILHNWLAERGLSLAQDKTRIVHLDEGFDFLGFNIRQYRSTRGTRTVTLTKPSLKAVKNLKMKLITIWEAAASQSLAKAIARLNAVIRGWANYYRCSVCSSTFSKLDHWMFEKAYRFALKRHPRKGRRWVVNRYFVRRGGNRWIFSDKATGATLLLFNQTKVYRQPPVRGRASPDDATLAAYWDRRQKATSSALPIHRRLLAIRQDWKCPRCGEALGNGEPLRICHVKPRAPGDAGARSVLLHLFCYRQMCSQRKPEAARGS